MAEGVELNFWSRNFDDGEDDEFGSADVVLPSPICMVNFMHVLIEEISPKYNKEKLKLNYLHVGFQEAGIFLESFFDNPKNKIIGTIILPENSLVNFVLIFIIFQKGMHIQPKISDPTGFIYLISDESHSAYVSIHYTVDSSRSFDWTKALLEQIDAKEYHSFVILQYSES
jgi:hypothetical protein